jgi:hypothetical protein
VPTSGGSSSGAGRFQPAISPPAAGRRGMSGDSAHADGSLSRSCGRRFGGWNSDSPPGLTATPNGGGGTCGTRRGNGGGDPPGSGTATAGPRASIGWSGTASDHPLETGSRPPRAVDTLSENTDPAGSDDPGARGGENQEYGWRAPRAGGSGSGSADRGTGTGGSACDGTGGEAGEPDPPTHSGGIHTVTAAPPPRSRVGLARRTREGSPRARP